MSFDLQLAGMRALVTGGCAASTPPWSKPSWKQARASYLRRARFRAERSTSIQASLG